MSNKIWHKQKWEDDFTFQIFHRWLMLDPERDLDEAYRLAKGARYTDQGEIIVAPNHVIRSYRGQDVENLDMIDWEKRAREFDAEQQRKDVTWWLEQQRRIRKREFNVAQLLMSKAQEMLDWPLYTEEEKETEDGIVIVRTPARWRFSDASNLIKLASELQRLAANMEQSIQKLVLTLSPEAMEAIDKLEKFGVSYGSMLANFERTIIDTAKEVDKVNLN